MAIKVIKCSLQQFVEKPRMLTLWERSLTNQTLEEKYDNNIREH